MCRAVFPFCKDSHIRMLHSAVADDNDACTMISIRYGMIERQQALAYIRCTRYAILSTRLSVSCEHCRHMLPMEG